MRSWTTLGWTDLRRVANRLATFPKDRAEAKATDPTTPTLVTDPATPLITDEATTQTSAAATTNLGEVKARLAAVSNKSHSKRMTKRERGARAEVTDRSARLSRAETVERFETIGTRLWAGEVVTMRLTVRARFRSVESAPCFYDFGWSTAAALAGTRTMVGARTGVADGSAAMTANGRATRMAETARFPLGGAEALAVADSRARCGLVGTRISPNVSATDTEAQTLEETEPAAPILPWRATVRDKEMAAFVRGQARRNQRALFTPTTAPFHATLDRVTIRAMQTATANFRASTATFPADSTTTSTPFCGAGATPGSATLRGNANGNDEIGRAHV